MRPADRRSTTPCGHQRSESPVAKLWRNSASASAIRSRSPDVHALIDRMEVRAMIAGPPDQHLDPGERLRQHRHERDRSPRTHLHHLVDRRRSRARRWRSGRPGSWGRRCNRRRARPCRSGRERPTVPPHAGAPRACRPRGAVLTRRHPQPHHGARGRDDLVRDLVHARRLERQDVDRRLRQRPVGDRARAQQLDLGEDARLRSELVLGHLRPGPREREEPGDRDLAIVVVERCEHAAERHHRVRQRSAERHRCAVRWEHVDADGHVRRTADARADRRHTGPVVPPVRDHGDVGSAAGRRVRGRAPEGARSSIPPRPPR